MRPIAVMCVALLAVGCDGGIAPANSTIELAADRLTIPVGGERASISATVREQSGEKVVDGTQVFLSTTIGLLCEDQNGDGICRGREPAASISAKTKDGIASAYLISGAIGGTATVTASSGSISKNISISISNSAAANGSKMLLQVSPESLARSDTAELIAFLTDSGGVPVPDKTVIQFTARGLVRPGFALTSSGFAFAKFIPDTAGTADTLVAISGKARDTAVVAVVP